MKYKIRVKESCVAEYLVEYNGDSTDKETIFGEGEIIDTLDDGNGESVGEEVISLTKVE